MLTLGLNVSFVGIFSFIKLFRSNCILGLVACSPSRCGMCLLWRPWLSPPTHGGGAALPESPRFLLPGMTSEFLEYSFTSYMYRKLSKKLSAIVTRRTKEMRRTDSIMLITRSSNTLNKKTYNIVC